MKSFAELARVGILMSCLSALTAGVSHAGLEDDLESRWLGAWVISTTELYSDCDGNYTNNEVHGELVQAEARIRFPAGELAQVAKVDVNRQRVDVLLDVREPVRMDLQDGPFQLYESRTCRVELEIDVPGRSKEAGFDLIEERFELILRRHERLADAESSEAWNRRSMRPFPADYEETVAEYRSWKAEQLNRTVQAEIDSAVANAAELVAQASSDENFGVGSGMSAMRNRLRDANCQTLLSADLNAAMVRSPGNQGVRWDRGFYFGQRLAFFVLRARLLQNCFSGSG